MAFAITPTDMELVGQMAAHCDNKKLQIAFREAVNFELSRLFGSLWLDIETNWDSLDAKWVDLINGSEYVGCKDKTRKQRGVKEILIYFTYARYIVLNGFNDTPSGHVQKTNSFSIPKPLKELQQFSDKYRNMGLDTLDGVKNFLCVKTKEDDTLYPNYDRCDCNPCGCGGECGTETGVTKGFGLRSKTISKWDA